jgi:Putative DNA-binding domain
VEIQRLTVDQIRTLVLTRPEQIVFDTKRDFRPPRDDDARAEFIKDAVAIANGTASTGGPGFVVYGVDVNVPDLVVGISERYDDASLQQLVASHVEPAIDFAFYDDLVLGDGSRIAVLHVSPSTKPFHVIVKDVGGLRDGTSFIRQGSSTRGLRRSDWMRLCLGANSQYLAQALAKYGVQAQVIAAQAALINAGVAEEQHVLRQLDSMLGLPPRQTHG